MKILLVEPPKAPSTIGGEDVFLFEPLALEYLAAGVSKEHEVRILDLRLDKDLQRNYTDFHPDIVGITAYTVHVNVVRRLFEQVKGWNPRALTVVGGHHATVMPEDFLSPFIHTQLPTALPLKDFYAEYHDLYTKGIALSKQLSLLRKYPLWEIPHLLAKGRRFYHRLKTAYLDYAVATAGRRRS